MVNHNSDTSPYLEIATSRGVGWGSVGAWLGCALIAAVIIIMGVIMLDEGFINN